MTRCEHCDSFSCGRFFKVVWPFGGRMVVCSPCYDMLMALGMIELLEKL